MVFILRWLLCPDEEEESPCTISVFTRDFVDFFVFLFGAGWGCMGFFSFFGFILLNSLMPVGLFFFVGDSRAGFLIWMCIFCVLLFVSLGFNF